MEPATGLEAAAIQLGEKPEVGLEIVAGREPAANIIGGNCMIRMFKVP
jgi:hypothetical protein